MPELKNSSRVTLKATYVIKATPEHKPVSSPADRSLVREPPVFAKAEFVRSLRLSSDEGRSLEKHLDSEDRDALCKLLPMIESSAPEAQSIHAPTLANIPAVKLISIAKSLQVTRRSMRTAMLHGSAREPKVVMSKRGPSEPILLAPLTIEAQIRRLKEQADLEPVGWLHLERLEMKPTGASNVENSWQPYLWLPTKLYA